MEEGVYRLISFSGFLALGFLAWVTGRRSRVSWKTVIGSGALAWALGGLTFGLPWSRNALNGINDILIALLNVYQKGNIFLFGPLALGPGEKLADGTASIGFVLAMQVLPAVIFFSALVSALYYLKIMPVIVRGFAWIFYRVMGISGAEALSAAANIFVGIESSLTVRPYLAGMTRSELLTLLTCMMSTVASTVMAIYVIALKGVFPEIAGHLLSASIISIPCAILVSKLALPEDQQPVTLGDLPKHDPPTESGEGDASANLIVTLINGGMQGVKMAVGIAVMLIVFLGLEAMLDLVLGLWPSVNGSPVSLSRLLGWGAWPFTVLLGLRPEEWQIASQIIGARFVETEVTSYFSLAAVQAGQVPALTGRSLTVLTYVLCGFVHIASMGIFVGGLTAVVPSRAGDISRLGIKALWTAFLATLLTGCLAGVMA
ncbi:MAG: nucleoside permease nupX [Nitrospinaceae bacterium]|nr:nucleoside permease nupX [Nitrospinaceae bacterium]NIR57962.1 nucleoside permease nupX [Nitrospinaceae bacterium]NIS88427.1 nucleoside permease nupX [Nitrospinaceae bacterium]NIT85300.1 nucleoside permease nupX [Nitrospinaceae bacterium]NIU47458.1 nucleoside permease nupX [Nitrospinaceae bacterium]